MKTPELNEINQNLKRYSSRKFIKHNYPEFFEYLINNYPTCNKITEAMWLYYNNLKEAPKCIKCGKYTNFKNWTEGYTQYCSRKCMSQSTRHKACKTMIDLYGGIGMAAEETRKKIESTNLERYGYKCSFNNPESVKKRHKTMIERYGAQNPMHCKEIVERLENTMMERYGVKRALQNKECLEKSKNTCLKNYGVEYPGQNKEILKKAMDTQIKRYGGVGMASEEISKKIISTNLKRRGRKYGFDYDKIKQTNIEKYGDENPLIARCARGEILFKGYSNSSQQLFKQLDDIFNGKYETYYATKNCEYCVEVDDHKYYIGYFIKDLNLAIEFNGDTWHGNPSRFKPDDKCFPMNDNITAKDLWDMDRARIDRLKTVGITTVVMWESEYKKCKDLKQWLNVKLKDIISDEF